jgi:hypothetical protein
MFPQAESSAISLEYISIWETVILGDVLILTPVILSCGSVRAGVTPWPRRSKSTERTHSNTGHGLSILLFARGSLAYGIATARSASSFCSRVRICKAFELDLPLQKCRQYCIVLSTRPCLLSMFKQRTRFSPIAYSRPCSRTDSGSARALELYSEPQTLAYYNSACQTSMARGCYLISGIKERGCELLVEDERQDC